MNACYAYLGAASNGAQELGVVSHGGAAVWHTGGELGSLAEVVLLVGWRLVVDSCQARARSRETSVEIKISKKICFLRRVQRNDTVNCLFSIFYE